MQLSREEIYNSWGQKLAWLIHFLKAKFRHKEKVLSLSKYIPENSLIIDIGAHLGYFAKEFCSLHKGRCHVICFEPVTYTHSILTKVLHGFHNKKIEFRALSNDNGTADISIPIKKSGHLGIGLSHLGAELSRNYIIETITTIKLDDYIIDNPITRLDFIKCDVEGAELFVLEGAKETIEKYMPTIFIEVNNDYTKRLNYPAQDIFSFLENFGYKAFKLDRDGTVKSVDKYSKCDDYLFVAQ